MRPSETPLNWDCGPNEAMVRNRTGVTQVFAVENVVLQPGEWATLPRQRAYQLRSAGIVDLYLPSDPGCYLWRDGRGAHVYWMSPFSLGDGYGTGAEHTVNSAIDLGLNAKLAACWFLEERGIQLRTLKNLKQPPSSAYLVGICMATPGEFKKLPTPYKIGFTMYESTNPLRHHPEWRPECNAVDRLFVPSKWCRDLFSRFVKKPIDVVPLVVNPLYCVAKRREPRSTFTFISFATALTDRKGPLPTAELFAKAFPRQKYPHVRLKLKAKLSDRFLRLAEAYLSEIQDDRISVVTGAWLQEQMLDFMLEADAMLFLTHGEGFGLPPREALVTGLPVVVADHTGMRDLCDPRYVWPVRTKETVPCPLGGDWFVPDSGIAIDMMRSIVEGPEKAFAKAHRGAEWYVKRNDARVLVQTVEGLDPVPVVQNRQEERKEALRVPRKVLQRWQKVHQTFLDTMKDVRGPILEVGLGQGATHAEMLLRGFEMYGIEIDPEVLEACRQNLQDAYDLLVKAEVLDVFKLSPRRLRHLDLPTEYEAAFSEGLLEHFYDREIGQVVRAMLTVAPRVYFSVPSVYHSEVYPNCRQMRREQWIDIFTDNHLSLSSIGYYGNREYIMGVIVGESTGARGTVQRHGRVNAGVWRPRPHLAKPG